MFLISDEKLNLLLVSKAMLAEYVILDYRSELFENVILTNNIAIRINATDKCYC